MKISCVCLGLRLRFQRLWAADEVHGAPVAERHRRCHADEAHGRVDGAGAALAVRLLQLAVVAQERGDEHRDHHAHGEQDEERREAGRRQADAVHDLLAHPALEDGDAGRVVGVAGGRVAQRERQVDGGHDLVADLDADVGAAHATLVRDAVRAPRPFGALFVGHLELAHVMNVVNPV